MKKIFYWFMGFIFSPNLLKKTILFVGVPIAVLFEYIDTLFRVSVRFAQPKDIDFDTNAREAWTFTLFIFSTILIGFMSFLVFLNILNLSSMRDTLRQFAIISSGFQFLYILYLIRYSIEDRYESLHYLLSLKKTLNKTEISRVDIFKQVLIQIVLTSAVLIVSLSILNILNILPLHIQ
jgi:hypothetical protein